MDYNKLSDDDKKRHDILKKLDNDLDEENHLLNPGNSFEHMNNPISYKVINSMQRPSVQTKNPPIDVETEDK